MTRQSHDMHAMQLSAKKLTVHLMSQQAAAAVSQAGP